VDDPGAKEFTGKPLIGGYRIGARVLPTNVTVVDDPGAKEFTGKPLIGGYRVDDEGVPAEKVTVVENGALKELLMSRRPGPDSGKSNGHGRSAFLNDAKPTPSNLFFTSSETVPAAELKKKVFGHLPFEQAGILPGSKGDG